MSNKWFKKAAASDEESEEEEVSSDESVDEKPSAVSGKGWFGRKAAVSDSEESEEEEETEEELSDEEEEEKGDADKSKPTPQEKRNKWLKNSDAESDESSDSDSDLDDDDKQKTKKSRFLDSEDEESDEEKHEVRSTKEKFLEQLSSEMFKLSTKISANAWKDIGDSLNDLIKIVNKVANLKILTYQTSGYLPKSYIKFAADLEDSAERAFNNKKKLPVLEQKVLGGVRGKIRKMNADVRVHIGNYQKDPDAYVDEESENEDEEETREKSWFDKTEEQQLSSTGAPTEQSQEGGWAEAAKKEKKTDVKKPDQKKKPQKSATNKKLLAGPKTQKVERIITELNLEERLIEMRNERGYRGTNPGDQLLELEKYLKVCESPDKIIQVLFMIISTLFDIPPSSASFVPVDIWKVAISNFARICHLLRIDRQQEKPTIEFPQLVPLYERLDTEFIKSLQFIDPHTQDYVTRLRDEILMLDVGERVFELCSNDKHKQALVAVRLIEHLYYRKQEDHARMFKAQRDTIPVLLTEFSKTWVSKSETIEPINFTAPSVVTEDLHNVVVKLSNLVFADAATHNYAQQNSIKCVIYLIYHLALRGDWERARDLMLKTKIGDVIGQLVDRENRDVSLLICYNRAICQLGICAFRNGLITEAHFLLSEICSSGKVKELLAQGSSARYTDKSKKSDQEKAEKSKSVLYHKHINVDLLDAVHLISAMLLEVPNMAHRTSTKRKVISKSFKRLIEFYHRQVFLGPPENTRDHINAATKFLSIGDWRQTYQNLAALEDMWALMIDGDSVKAMLKEKVKIEALRTYLFSFGQHYDTVCVTSLANQFELEEKVVHSVVSKLMINEELHAAFDQPTNTFKMFRSEPNPLQQLALQLSERAASFVEWNEKMYEAKSQGGSLIIDGKEDQRKKKMARGSKGSKQSGNATRAKRTTTKRTTSTSTPAKTY